MNITCFPTIIVEKNTLLGISPRRVNPINKADLLKGNVFLLIFTTLSLPSNSTALPIFPSTNWVLPLTSPSVALSLRSFSVALK